MNLFESIRYTVQALSGLVFRDQRAFDDGDVIGGLKLFDPNTIIENLTRSPTYALKLNDNKLFHKAIQDWEDCTKVLTKPVFQEACNGDIKAQKFYQDKRSIFYLLKDNSLKGNMELITQRYFSAKAIRMECPKRIKLSSKSIQLLERQFPIKLLPINCFGTITNSEIVLSHFESLYREKLPQMSDQSPLVRFGDSIDITESTKLGHLTRKSVSEIMQLLFQHTVFKDALEFLDIKLPEDIDEVKLFNLCANVLPWNILSEKSPLIRIRNYLDYAKDKEPKKDPWSHNHSLEKIIASSNFDKLFSESKNAHEIEASNVTQQEDTKSICIDNSHDEQRQQELEILKEGFSIYIQRFRDCSGNSILDYSKKFAKLVINYKGTPGADYISIVTRFTQALGENKEISEVYELILAETRAFNRINDTDFGNLEKIPDKDNPDPKTHSNKTVYIMHPELDSDLKDMSEELRTKCINKISEIKEKGIPSDTKTIKRIGGNSSSSIIKVRYHSKNSEAFRMYLRRISDEEYLILGVSAKESNNTAENKTHNKMFNRLDKYLEEQKKAAH